MRKCPICNTPKGGYPLCEECNKTYNNGNSNKIGKCVECQSFFQKKEADHKLCYDCWKEQKRNGNQIKKSENVITELQIFKSRCWNCDQETKLAIITQRDKDNLNEYAYNEIITPDRFDKDARELAKAKGIKIERRSSDMLGRPYANLCKFCKAPYGNHHLRNDFINAIDYDKNFKETTSTVKITNSFNNNSGKITNNF